MASVAAFKLIPNALLPIQRADRDQDQGYRVCVALRQLPQSNRSLVRRVEPGVTCTVCHSIQKVDTKLGDGSFTLAVPAVLVDD